MPQMLPTASLGRTELVVTRLGYGAMEIRGGPRGRDVTPREAGEVLNAVLDAGVNYIDTSIDYGRSEEFIGKYLSHRRSEYFLASKCGCAVGAPTAPPGQRSQHVFTRDNIIAGVEQSLTRMKTDRIDVVQFHAAPSRETLKSEGAIDTLLDLKSQGKIRFIGMSSTLPNLADHIAMDVFDVVQIPYSALQREHEDSITQAADAGIGTVIRGGVAKGAPGVSGVNRAAVWQKFDEAKLDELREEGESRTAFMLRFTLAHPQIHTIIVGTLQPGHLLENVSVAEAGSLPIDVYDEARRRLDAVGISSTEVS